MPTVSSKPHPPEPTKPTLYRRVSKLLAKGSRTRIPSPIMDDGDPVATPVHQGLPEEATDKTELQTQMLRLSQQSTTTQAKPRILNGLSHQSTTSQTAPRIQSGPIPRKSTTADIQRHGMNHELQRFTREIDIAFLAPKEADVLHIMSNTSRCSYFRPLLEPKAEVLLCQPQDIEPLQNLRDLVRNLEPVEKVELEGDLKVLLLPEQMYVLRLLLYHDGLLVTTHTRGSRLEIHEDFGRPDSVDMFGPWRREWEAGAAGAEADSKVEK